MFAKQLFVILFAPSLLNRIYTQEECKPTDCIVSEWNNWSACTETCGENGTRVRLKTVFRAASCGGACSDILEETEPCNIKCCPKDCVYSEWSKWGLCFCDAVGCEGGGERYNCSRTRTKLQDKECGGYCDDVTIQEQCGNLCCYQNCAVSAWSFWGMCQAQCEQTGTKRRIRKVVQEPRCHGKQCGALEEVIQCTGGCCPVDCILGEWSDWSSCNVTCGESVETRVRFVQLPDCNGKACSEEPTERETRPCSRYINVYCMVSPWTLWSDCILDNGFCGKGIRTRSRTVERYPECQGHSCQNLTETGICYGQCCVQDCVVSDWTVWSHCSTACGQGIRNRTRAILQLPSCGGSPCTDKLLDKKDCVVRDRLDCEFTDWSRWTACSTDCGVGVQGRTRTLITPAYCGGQCENEAVEEEKECESYEAKQDCEVSEWSPWGVCVRNCARGDQTRNRTVIVNAVCTGTPCPADLVEHRDCHLPCEQLCNLGVCSCNLGYRLSSDNVTCSEVVCPIPKVSYCPPTHREITDCRQPYFMCADGYKFNKTCTPYCSPSDWTVKGTPLMVTCQKDGTWTRPDIYCSRPNKPPVGIEVDTTVIEENRPIDFCFAYLSSITDGEEYEVHTYTIVRDVTNRFYIRNNRLCLAKKTDYEEEPSKWDVTFRSTDIDGEYVEQAIMFEITNANDAPTSVKIEPDSIPENSPPNTVVGCLSASDDDPNQNVTLTLVDSYQETFATFEKDGNLCIKVIADSDPRCTTDGGTYCTLNKEVKDTHYITILAMDDGIPPMSAYYDIPIKLTNVNDKQTSIDIDPKQIPEERDAGSPLIRLLTIDEDSNQQYTYKLLDDNNGLFKISGGDLTATRVFDFEKEASEIFEVTVESTDDDSENPLKVSKRLVMQIADVNERPYDLQLSSIDGIYQFQVNKPRIMENVPDGVIGTVTVKDDDALDNIRLHIVTGVDANGRLSLIDKKCSSLATVNVYCTATLMLTGSLNYEVEDHVDIVIEAKDKMNATASLNLSVEVLDTNDPPTKLLFDGKEEESLTVQEFQQHVRICNLSAVDEDVDVSHTFELVDSSGGLFVIENAELWTSKDSVIDYEIETRHTITVKCVDNGNPPISTLFDVQIIVIDVNEEPTITMLSNNKVAENSPDDTFVGELTTIDPDNEVEQRQSFRYSLPEDSKGRFKLDGNRILVKSSSRICGNKPCGLDYEIEPELYVTVLTMDDGFPRLQRLDTFTIELENANDPPTDVKLTNSVIKENQPAGMVIGVLIAEDQDGEETFGFSLNDHQDLFGIEDGNKIVTKMSLDYEYLRSYRVRVSVADSGIPPAEAEEMLVIQVLNINEAPRAVNLSGSVAVREDADINSPAAALFISDPDTDETLTVTIEDMSGTFRLEEPVCNTTPATGATDCTVNLVTKKVLDANKRSMYPVTLTIQDQRGLLSTYSVNINVIDVNNAPTNILVNNLDTVTFDVPEDVDITKIAQLHAVDADIGQTFEYNIIFDSSGLFRVFENTIKSTEPLDYESEYKNITLVIKATDSGSPPLSVEKTYTLLIDDVNEPPTSLTLLPSEVKENSFEGTTVGIFEIEDPDEHGKYDIVLVNNLNGLFVVENGSLKVGLGACVENRDVSCKIDFEKQQTFTLTALVKDNGTPPTSAQFDFTIAVLDVNEPPRSIQLQGNKVEASTVGGTVVGHVTATEDDAEQTYTFELLNATDTFSINLAHQLIVKNSSLLNNGEVLSMKVKVTDDGNPPASSEAILTVIVTEDSNLTISLSSEGMAHTFPLNNVTVRENSSIGERVGTMITSIPEYNRTFDILISKGGEMFCTTETQCTSLQDGMGSECRADLLVKSLLDFEKDQSVELIVEVNSDDGKKAFEHYRIRISDINENPTDIEYSENTIYALENTVDEFLGQFYAKDPDLGDLHSFQIFGSNAFVLFENGTLLSATNASVDFETTEQIDVVVKVTDRGGLSFNKSFTIHVVDVNEKPLGLNISNNKIPERAEIGTPVGTLQVNDPDADQLFTFEIMSGNDAIFDIDGNVLKVVKEGEFCSTYGNDFCLLDYETRSTYTLKIKVTDSGNPAESELFDLEIIVEDVNDKPGAIQISSTKVDEDTSLNDVVANLTAIDRDANQTITFTIEPPDMFYIINSSLVLNTSLDFERRSSYTLTVQAHDDGIPSLLVSSTFILEVIDVNEPPVILTLVHTVDSSTQFPEDSPQIEENLPPSTYIGRVIVNDPDNGEDISLQILSANLMFKKEDCIPLTKGTRCTWGVSSVRPFDFEKENNLTFTAIATDGNGLQMQKNFLLEILDSNDAPTDILLTVDNATVNEISVLENSVGTLLAKLSVEDEETDQSYIYDVSDSTKSLFVSGDELRVTSAARLDYERLQQFSLSIKVTDSGLPTLSYVKQFSVLIQDVNEAPNLAYLSNSEIAENSTVDEEVGKIIVQDPDNIKQDIQTFTIAVIDENVPFRIEGHRLVVTKSEFDLSDYTIRINVTDSGTPPLSEQFQVRVHVLDVNNPPTRLDFTGSVVDENTAIREIIGELQGRDDDTGQELTYKILDSDKFSVNNSAVVVNGLIDFERGQEIMFTAMVTDNGQPPLSLERSFTVIVEDVNERPRSLKLIRNDNMTISERTSIDETIAVIEVTDEDETEIFEGSITVGEDLFKLALSGFVCERQEMETYKVPMTVCTNDLLLAAPLDYETITEPVSVMITARDKGGLELKQLFTFGVTNENEPPRDIVLDTELDSIPENSDGFVVGGLSTIDDDRSDSHFYQVITHWETFTIIGNKLFVRTLLDYERQDSYIVTIRTTDNGSPVMSLNKDFVLRVADVNEAPTEIELSHNEVEAGAEAGTVVGHIAVVDPDNLGNPELPQTHDCKVSPTELFAVDSEDSVIAKVSIPVDMTSYNVTITCSDSGMPQMSGSQEFQIHIVESINAPKGIQLIAANGGKNLNVDENVIDRPIGNLSVVNLLTGNPDAGSYTFVVESNTDVDFTILGSTVQLLSAVNYEVMPSIELKVWADGLDSAGNQLNLDEIFKIEVNDVNEPPTDIRVYGDSQIEENSPSGMIVGDLYTVDPEDYQTYTYKILGVNFGFEVASNSTDLLDVFTIDSKTLKVGSNAGALNYEVSDVITILVQSTDSGDIPYSVESTIHIKIVDINDPPTNITLSNNMVGENSPPGTVVGTLIVEEEDANQEHKCEILNIIDVPFKVENNTKVVVDYKLDYESDKSFNIKVLCGDTVPDGTRLKISRTLMLNISNVNEPPVDIHLTVTEIDEGNEIGQVVGEIKVTDLDSVQTFISLVQEDDWQMFDIEGDSTLVANVVFDFETKVYHTLMVNVTDDEGATALKRLEIQVKDINEPPVSIVLDQESVSENKLPGELIGKFTTSDPDNNQRFTYMLDDETAAQGIFVLKEDALRVGPMGLDFERQDLYLISVTSTDNGEPPKSVEVNFTVNIIDANEPPSGIIVSLTEAIPEVVPAHTVITAVRVDDPDVNQSHSCQLNDTSHVTLATKEGDVLELVLLRSLNFEETSALYLEISCTDGEFEIRRTVTIKVSDINEPPTSIKLSGSQTVRATAEPDHVIGQLTVDDEDDKQKHTFTILGANSDLVKVTENNELVLKAVIPSTQLEQFDPGLKFIITVADSGDPVLTYNQTFNIPITNIDIIADELPAVGITDRNITENSKRGTVIGRLFYLNETSSENLYMSIEDNFENLFKIQNETYLVLAQNFSTADTSSIFINIKVTDTVNQDFSLSKITLLVQRMCAGNQEMCRDSEKCVVHNDTYSECTCQQDFQKNSNDICIAINNCETGNDTMVLCQNGGTCIDDVNSFVCKCPDGFGGDRCEINKRSENPCFNHHCLNDAICFPDIDTGTYNCSCKTGWEGDNCQSSSDDCVDGVCYNGGQCIDKHLAYLCTCTQEYKGLRCEYGENICIEKHCNDTHLCVGLVLSENTLCVSEQLYNIDLTYDQSDDVPELQIFQARLVDFIITYGRLPTLSSSTVRKRRTTDIKEAQVYVVEAEELDSGQFKFSLVILNEEDEPFTRDEALSVLSMTCAKINSGDSSEALFCPGIQEAARKPPAPSQATSSAGLIAGVICSLVIVAGITAVAFVIYKKKKRDNAVRPEGIETGMESRRSSGYSSLTRVGRPSSSPRIAKNRVAPDPTSETTASSVSDLDSHRDPDRQSQQERCTN